MIFGGTGRGKFRLLAQFIQDGRGLRTIYNTFSPLSGRGKYVVELSTYSGLGRGKYYIGFEPYGAQGRGKYKFLIYCAEQGRGFHRVANDALAEYELYRGVDGSPDFDSDPWETFANLPHESAALDPDHTYHFVLRKRNAWDLVSQNIAEWVVAIDASGNQEVTHPSAPEEITIEAAAGGKAKVKAYYYYDADGENQATKFLVYLTSDGSDPNPETDEPTEVTMSKTGGIAKLNWLSSAYADETTIKVLIRTRRVDDGPVNIDSINTDIYSAEADTDGPAKPDPAGIFFGKIIEQRQGS